MATFLGAFPILPGKEAEARKFAEEVQGRIEEYSASLARGGITKEAWALQQTPMGTIVLVHFEAADVEAAFADLAQSKEEIDVWFKGRVKEINGVDLEAPSDDPPPEVLFDWKA